MKFNDLTPEEKQIIENKGTEAPFSGEYDDFYKEGIYVCRRCNNPLFESAAKYDAGCGWPAFDDNFPNAVKRIPDADGSRTEIQCANCEAHLGHVFEGEKLTEKDTRHCVNSLSILFVPKEAK
jgi:methionine-R-sulfoxide reductase